MVSSLSNTIIFGTPDDNGTDGDVAVLAAGDTTVAVAVLFVEGRCDAHARSEASQPFQFFAQIDLGDGIVRPFAVVPEMTDQAPMRARLDRACEILGTGGFAGQSTNTTLP